MTEFVLHIGRHKSGTTSLQRFLHANRLVLQREGLVYPETPAGAFAHHEIAEVFARRIRKASRELNTDESRTVARITDVAASSGKKVLLSSEGFQNADPAVVAQYFPPGKTQVIVYVREQADYVLSSYQQKVHAHNHFLRLDTSFQQSVVDYDKFLSGWEKAFGREHIVVRAYERKLLKDGDIIADFLELLGLDQVLDLAFDNEDQNPSIGGQLLEFKRFLNACGTDSINAGRLYGVLSRLASRDPAYRARPHMAQAIATNIRGSVRESNRRVFERYFEGRDVFNYRSTESVDGPQNCDANAVVEVLRQIGNEDPVVSRQIVSRISASLGFASPTS
ncbi:MAG TPA: hypothetical protein VK968_17705, partial [Roseimicrobium sp.]|nr:hypothetical protein [Roseimicrobium sp.]